MAISLRINPGIAILRKVIAILTSDEKIIPIMIFRTEKGIVPYGKSHFSVRKKSLLPYGKIIFPYGKHVFSV